MNSIDEALLSLKDELNSQPEVKEYLELKKQVLENKEIIFLEKEVRTHQKEMCKNKDNDEIYLKEKSLYESKLEELNKNPLYINYLQAKEEVLHLLMEVRDQLQ